MECRSYGVIKLLENAMKVVVRFSEYKIQQQIGKRTTDAISVVSQMQE